MCVLSIRSPGSAAVNMCLVACGSADAYYHMGIHCWDMAGGAAVITEAGGVIMDISGEAYFCIFKPCVCVCACGIEVEPLSKRLLGRSVLFAHIGVKLCRNPN